MELFPQYQYVDRLGTEKKNRTTSILIEYIVSLIEFKNKKNDLTSETSDRLFKHRYDIMLVEYRMSEGTGYLSIQTHKELLYHSISGWTTNAIVSHCDTTIRRTPLSPILHAIRRLSCNYRGYACEAERLPRCMHVRFFPSTQSPQTNYHTERTGSSADLL